MIETYTKNGKTIKYQIIIKNNKHMYFHFKPELLVITKNKKVPNERVINIIDNDFDKIYQKINRKQKLNDNEFLYFAKVLDLIVLEGKKLSYEIDDKTIKISKPFNKKLDDVIKYIYKIELTRKIKELEPKIEVQINKLNLELVPFKVKDVKSYYGKCFMGKKEIMYSLKLAKLDPIFLEYVIYHEYAHFIEGNHSKKFYQVLKKLMPNYQEVQKKLRKIKI
ncbi:MAG: M48 family metallopeptidase [Acholeplasmataceae bacterium]|jgi:predicted metal-dependent hydrolase|nr:M48 family metallopeptidase [Acholeplasmataceae bacterium]